MLIAAVAVIGVAVCILLASQKPVGCSSDYWM